MSLTAEDLFRQWFLPLYPDDVRRDLAAARAVDANPGGNTSFSSHLRHAADTFASNAAVALGLTDSDLALDYSDASVHRLSHALTSERRDRLVGLSSPGEPNSTFFNFVIHGAAYVGECIVQNHKGHWQIRRPLWESMIRLDSPLGTAELAIFHWWLKAMADNAQSTLADRYRTHVEVPCLAPLHFPIIAPADRALPRLKRPRYDLFYKYLRAHLPELRDVGADFPSPERFEEFRFESLQPTLVGEGRMLVIHGSNAHGLHAFWLSKNGFEKSAFWPCDAFPEPIMRATNSNTLEVILSKDNVVQNFEVLWWGP